MNGRANVGEFDNAESGILTPTTVDDVRSLIETVPTDTRIHAFSTGYNWGLGSSVPVDSQPTSISLAALKAVRDIDIELGCGGRKVVHGAPGALRSPVGNSLRQVTYVYRRRDCDGAHNLLK